MFYKVEKEECGKGINKRYSIGQIINSVDVEKIKQDFNKYRHTYYESAKDLKLEYYNLGLFDKKEFIYSLLLKKMSKF